MNGETKHALSLYALAYAFTALVAFRAGGSVPVPTAYVLLLAVYAIPVWLAVRGRLGERLAVALLVVTPVLPALVVVDPLEVGFYGYDPYVTLRTATEFATSGPLAVARDRFAWPGFYAFLHAVTAVTGISLTTVGKYLPLVVVVTPALLYLFARRVVPRRAAFLVAMGFAGVRTLYTFEAKFVDESTAFVLFFSLLLFLALRSTARESSVSALAGLFAVAAVLTHHYVGALAAFLLVLWDLADVDSSRLDVRILHRRLSGLTVVTILAFSVMVLAVAPGFVGFLGSVADVSPSIDTGDAPGPSNAAAPSEDAAPPTEDGGGASGVFESVSLRLLQLLAANLALVALLAVVVASFRTWFRSSPAPVVCGAFGSVLAVGYGYSVAFGPVIPLDPSRYLLYMTAALLVVAGYAFDRTDLPVDSAAALSALVGLLVLTQLVLVPPAVVYSSQERSVVGEDHYSPSQLAASAWVAEYDGGPVAGWERHLWRINDVGYVSVADGNCSVLRVWRSDAPTAAPTPNESVVYDNGRMRLLRCQEPFRSPT